jgi:hypothetical protein
MPKEGLQIRAADEPGPMGLVGLESFVLDPADHGLAMTVEQVCNLPDRVDAVRLDQPDLNSDEPSACLRRKRARGVLMEIARLVAFDLSLIIENARADLQKAGPLAQPAPLLKCAWRQVPPRSQFVLRVLSHELLLLLMRTETVRSASGKKDRGDTAESMWTKPPEGGDELFS